MAEFQRFSTGTGEAVYFAVESATGDGGLDRALNILGAIAEGVSQEVAGMPEDKRPEEVDISFGLLPGPDGGFAVAQSGQGHLQVTMRWSSDFAEDIGDIG